MALLRQSLFNEPFEPLSELDYISTPFDLTHQSLNLCIVHTPTEVYRVFHTPSSDEDGSFEITIEILLLHDQSCFVIDSEFKFITFYPISGADVQMYTIANAPSMIRNMTTNDVYPLSKLLSEALRLYQEAVSEQTQLMDEMKKKPISHALDSAISMKCCTEMGDFVCYRDNRIFVEFHDRTILRMHKYADTCTIINKLGESFELRLKHPIGYERFGFCSHFNDSRYVYYVKQFISWLDGESKRANWEASAKILERNRQFLRNGR